MTTTRHNFTLDPETRDILQALPEPRTMSKFVSLLILSSRRNPNLKGRELAQRELDLLIEKLTQ